MLKHLFPRLLIGAAALIILGFHLTKTNEGGGNNGMDVKWRLFVPLAILLTEGLYLVVEMLILGYKSHYRFAAINVGLLTIGIVVFLFLASR